MDGIKPEVKRVNVPVLTDYTKEQFTSEIYLKREPVVLRGFHLGSCTETWSGEYLAGRVTPRSIQAHVSPHAKMDFIHKNFSYKTLSFAELVRRCNRESELDDLHDFFYHKNEYYYLRCVGNDPRKDVAHFPNQFPELSSELIIPHLYREEELYSSVLRMASPHTQLWTHYDIMDNILLHIRGSKHVVLFKPEHVDYLYLQGDKSQVIDINNPDTEKFPLFPQATQYHCDLEPGDVLFIPALWFHNVLSSSFTVSVNVFWRHLPTHHYDHKDVYGNRDLVAGGKALALVNKATKLVEDLPKEYRHFYMRRMMGELSSKMDVT